ncbi:ZN436 protein, partial [Tachuris rubrigastra]|nr:ZN436 protein [Tachuris rubrigastra]
PPPKPPEGAELFPCEEKGFPPQPPGETPFPCTHCGDGFCPKVPLLRPPEVPPNFSPGPPLLGPPGAQPGLGDAAAPPEKPFICNQCGNSFGLWLALVAHQKSHAGHKPCPGAPPEPSPG